MAAEFRSYQSNQPAIPFDIWLVTAIVLLICIGLVMVTSSSIAIAEKQFHVPLYYLYRVLEYLTIGLILAVIVYRIPMVKWQQWGPGLLLISIFLLTLVLWFGKQVNGSTRWLCFASQCFQVSELAKFSLIIYMAGFLLRHEGKLKETVSAFVPPFLILTLIGVLLLFEPDFGALTVMVLSVVGMLFLGGISIRKFIIITGTALTVMVLFVYVSGHNIARLTSFLEPCARENAYGSGYQLCQALIAFGQGGVFGVGLGSSVQKLFYLPEAHTDFIFAVLGEELGLMGVVAVLGLYGLIIARACAIGRAAELRVFKFAAYCAYGLGFWIAIQALISMGVNTGLLPTKGLTLPFISYGGSNFLMMMISVAVLMRVDYENQHGVKVKKAVAWRVAS